MNKKTHSLFCFPRPATLLLACRKRFITGVHPHLHFILLLFALLFGGFVALYLLRSDAKQPLQAPTSEETERLQNLNWELGYIRDIDILQQRLRQYQTDNDQAALLLCYKHLGRQQRDNALFSNAIRSHHEGLSIALSLNDTVEIVQALNNLGTDFRRIGALAEASDYHYRALDMAQEYSASQTAEGTKNRVISMNGIGNINLTLGNLEEAEQFFRNALVEEEDLGSHLGQAINLANLGAIYEQSQRYDSAEVYYRRSMEQNRLAGSEMGQGLCYTHLGHIYKKQQLYATAMEHYEQAYRLMDRNADRWHWLETCIALAEIHLLRGNEAEHLRYIRHAEETAEKITSPEHLAAIRRLQHDYELRHKRYDRALERYKECLILEDSVRGVEKSNRYADLRVNFERERNQRQIQRVEAENLERNMQKQMLLYALGMGIFFLLILLGVLWYAYRQRIRHNRILHEMERTRSDFFTGITHEFRTPITVVRGLLDEMRKQPHLPEAEYLRSIDTMAHQNEMLLSLVNQLLDIARVRSGKDNPDWRKGDIVSYLRAHVSAYELHARHRGVHLDFSTSSARIDMDFVPAYIDKVVSNLLSNAFKHTPRGGFIHVFLAEEGGQNLLLNVSDSGPGIPSTHLPHLFELFYSSAKSTGEMSSGIGLTFSRLLIEKMGGTIHASNLPTGGALFTVHLPLAHNLPVEIAPLEEVAPHIEVLPYARTEVRTATTLSEVETPPTNDIEQEEKPLLLIAEDNEALRFYLSMLLSSHYRLLMAEDGEQALQMAHQLLPDLVITDIMMPRRDGISLCTEIKSAPLLCHIPVVMLTALGTEDDRIKGLRYGADAYLSKPFKAEELLLTLVNLLAARQHMQQYYARLMDAQPLSKALAKAAPPAIAAKSVAEGPKGIAYASHTEANLAFLDRVNGWIDTHLDSSSLTPSTLAEGIALSLSQLNRKLNVLIGTSASAYILQRRLRHARQMLESGEQSVADVAARCGFSAPSHLSRTFKAAYGISPSEVRPH